MERPTGSFYAPSPFGQNIEQNRTSISSSLSSSITAPRYRSVLRLIESRFHVLFPDINRANKATARLAALSEDMRILSLNAELLAGRSGRSGAAVRALTQYTRGLVRRLMDINDSVTGLRTLYGMSTATLRCLRYLRQIESTSALLGSALQDGRGRSAAIALERARQGYMTEMMSDIHGLTDGMHRLRTMIQVVDDIVAQAGSIATNIAAEAVSAQTHENDFTAVANAMRRYVEELRSMNDETARGLRGATEACDSMREIAVTLERQFRTRTII
ncbi:hypothetical protein CCP2SC5_230008 [Azospirillaceae bacterium]